MKKLILTICLVFSIGFVFEASATWYIIYDKDTGDYDAYYADDGRDDVIWMEY